MTHPNHYELLLALYFNSLIAFVERAFAVLRPGVPFLYGHHIRAICHKLEQVERGEIKRLIILMPPRHLKSVCVSTVFPAWVMGRNPSKRLICMSYGLDLAEGFSRDTRKILQSEVCQAAFQQLKLDPKRVSAGELRTTQNGFRMATSSGGPLTGKGADILILDDPIKAEDVASENLRDKSWEWLTGTVMTRLDNPKDGAVILVAQRLHEDDLAGRLIAAGGWEVLELPAIETRDREISLSDEMVWNRSAGEVLLPDHMDEAAFEAKRREIGSRAFEAQYQQSPTPAGGSIIRPEWFGTIPTNLRRDDYEAIVQSWDTASVPGESNDYSVCTTWGLKGNYIDLLDVYRGQHLYPELLQAAIKLRQTWAPHLIVVETQDVGRSLCADLMRQNPRGVRGFSPQDDKVQRMSAQTVKLERKEARLPVNAPWKEAFLAEAAAFPNGKYDDQVDTVSQLLRTLDRQPGELRHCSRFKG